MSSLSADEAYINENEARKGRFEDFMNNLKKDNSEKDKELKKFVTESKSFVGDKEKQETVQTLKREQ